MIPWTPPPATVTWPIDPPLSHGSFVYPAITLRAPTAGEVQKATAVRGVSNLEATQRLISVVSGEQVPYEAVQKLPHYIVEQMDTYMNLFGGSAYPGPLQEWLLAREAAEKAAPAAPDPGTTGQTADP